MEETSAAHLLVIGAGPGGYAAAFLAADLGLQVTLIDQEKNPGGVCLFRGCIPSKALLHAAKIITHAKDAKELGIEFGSPKIDLDKVRGWKNSVVLKLTSGLGQLCTMRKIRFIQGKAEFLDPRAVKIEKAEGGSERISFDHAVLATGSKPVSLPFAPLSKRIMDSTSALDIENIPQKLLVIGGGYIGLELATVYNALGSKTSVVELTPNLLPGIDSDLVDILKKRLFRSFENILLNTKVVKVEEKAQGVSVTFEGPDKKSSTQDFEKVLVAVGRKPYCKDLGLEHTGVKITQEGFVQVNEKRQSADPGIYAIGDIAGQPMLAHKASHEGMAAVRAIVSGKDGFYPKAIPAVVFTDPEIAWCGLTEKEAKEQGRDIKVLKFPWAASGRAVTLNRIDGLTKVVADSKSGRVLGVAMVGDGCAELISEGVLAVEMGSVADDLALSIHPHPTLSETVMEAAEIFSGQSTHFYKPKG